MIGASLQFMDGDYVQWVADGVGAAEQRMRASASAM